MHEGLRRRALRDPNPGDGESPVQAEWQRRGDANGSGDSRCGPVAHQLPRHPAHVLRSVSIFSPATILRQNSFSLEIQSGPFVMTILKVCEINYIKSSLLNTPDIYVWKSPMETVIGQMIGNELHSGPTHPHPGEPWRRTHRGPGTILGMKNPTLTHPSTPRDPGIAHHHRLTDLHATHV